MALRVVVLGLGTRGLDWARVIRRTGVVSLVGAADPDEAAHRRAARDAALHGVPLAGGLAELAGAAPDAAIVAAPPQQHAALTEQAIGAGLGVLVEKPFTLDLPSAVRLVKMADARCLPLLVAQNYRYMRTHRTVHRLLADGALGQLAAVTCHYWRASHAATSGLATLEASALWETGVHHLDALRYVLAQKVVGVAADVSTAPWTTHLHGTSARVLLEFEHGVRGEYSVSWDAPGHERFEAGQQFYERFTGERGTLHVLQRWLVLCRTGQWPRLVRRGSRLEPEEAVLLRQLAAAHAGERVPDCSGRDNLQTLAIVTACVDAWRTRRWTNPQELLRDAGA